jgi:hypothetical protein
MGFLLAQKLMAHRTGTAASVRKMTKYKYECIQPDKTMKDADELQF